MARLCDVHCVVLVAVQPQAVHACIAWACNSRGPWQAHSHDVVHGRSQRTAAAVTPSLTATRSRTRLLRVVEARVPRNVAAHVARREAQWFVERGAAGGRVHAERPRVPLEGGERVGQRDAELGLCTQNEAMVIRL
jgi:hypothetical protein